MKGSLVLSRRVDESIEIEHAGEKLLFTLLEIRGATVRTGWRCPQSFKIIRTELTQTVFDANPMPIGDGEQS